MHLLTNALLIFIRSVLGSFNVHIMLLILSSFYLEYNSPFSIYSSIFLFLYEALADPLFFLLAKNFAEYR